MASKVCGLLIFTIAQHVTPTDYFRVEACFARGVLQIDIEINIEDNGNAVGVFHKSQQPRDHRCAPLYVLIVSGALKTLATDRMITAEVYFDHNQLTTRCKGNIPRKE